MKEVLFVTCGINNVLPLFILLCIHQTASSYVYLHRDQGYNIS